MKTESRFSLTSWLVLTAALAFMVTSLGQLIYRLAQATDGWSANVDNQDEAVEFNLLGEATPLLAGDAILEIGGLPVQSDLTSLLQFRGTLPAGWKAGGSVPYQVRRQGQLVTLQVPLYRWRLGTLLGKSLDVLAVVMPGLGVLAVLVFLRRPENWGARALMMVGASFFSLTVSAFVNLTYDLRLASGALTIFFSFLIWATLLFPSFFLLALCFPQPKRFLAKHPWLTVAVLYGSAPLAMALTGQLEIGFNLVIVWSVLSIASVIHSAWTVRDRVGRAQLRWAGAGVTIGALTMIGNNSGLYNIILHQLNFSEAAYRLFSNLPIAVAFAATSIGFAVAIMRYNLFDIDVIIRRTLIYSVLTAMLALVYLGSVLVLQAVSGTLLGNSQSSLVAVLSTLAIAALFVPLRGRVQSVIDRRFFRSKYDAARTLNTFGARMRDEVDLNRLSEYLADVVDTAMQPEHISLWLKGENGQGARPAQAEPIGIARGDGRD